MAKRKSIMLKCDKCKITWAVGLNRVRQDKITPCPLCRTISKEMIEMAKRKVEKEE